MSFTMLAVLMTRKASRVFTFGPADAAPRHDV
jgi:hypothetical protein